MARSAILGNGTIAVGIDEAGLVHDFYFPFVGLENLNNARIAPHLIGIWINNQFSWLNDGSWESSVELSDEAMYVTSTHRKESFGIEIKMVSFVDLDYNAFIRQIKITNLTDKDINLRIFFHQVFEISRDGRSDTAMYVPDGHYILDYKGKASILIKAQLDNGDGFDQYAVGNYGIEGKEGTFKDAEDGELSMCAVEHAGVDSVLRLSCTVPRLGSSDLHYWVTISSSQFAAKKTNDFLLEKHLSNRLEVNKQKWERWVLPAKKSLNYASKEYRSAAIRSIFTIKAHMDKHGGIIASCDSSIYNYGRDYYSYVWPRDGAFAVWPFIKLGLYEEPKRYFEFCRDILAPGGYMMHKYQPDKAVGSTWHPLVHNNTTEMAIQEDETALILIMLGEYLNYSGDIKFVRSLYDSMVKKMADFMVGYIDKDTGLPHASYDLWEEKFLTSSFSAGATYKALHVAAQIAQALGYMQDHDTWVHRASIMRKQSVAFYNPARKIIRKGYLLAQDGSLQFDNTLDVSSLYGAFTFNFAHSRQSILETAEVIERELLDKTPSGGVPRYENDRYFRENDTYKGNPWFVTTLWMAQFYLRAGRPEKTREYINWTIKNALPSGVLSEQLHPETGKPISVTPLVWSHAELINTILAYTTSGRESS